MITASNGHTKCLLPSTVLILICHYFDKIQFLRFHYILYQ